MKIALSSLVLCFVAMCALASLRANERNPGSAFVVPEAKQPDGFPKPGKVGEFLIKQYPAYRAARVTNASMKQDSMFGQLFNHIKDNQISMTAPVEMKYSEHGTSSMSFLYANTNIGQTGSDGSVEVVDVPSSTVVSIGVRGAYEQDRFEQCRGKLQSWLEKNSSHWESVGPPRYLGYNSPFVPDFLKYGEIQVPIRPSGGDG